MCHVVASGGVRFAPCRRLRASLTLLRGASRRCIQYCCRSICFKRGISLASSGFGSYIFSYYAFGSYSVSSSTFRSYGFCKYRFCRIRVIPTGGRGGYGLVFSGYYKRSRLQGVSYGRPVLSSIGARARCRGGILRRC